MVFSDEDKAVIKNYYQRGYTAYKIQKENPEKNWDKASVKRLINRFVEKGTIERKEGSGLFFYGKRAIYIRPHAVDEAR